METQSQELSQKFFILIKIKMKLFSLAFLALPVWALTASKRDDAWPGRDLAECQEFYDQCMVHVGHGHTQKAVCTKGLGKWSRRMIKMGYFRSLTEMFACNAAGCKAQLPKSVPTSLSTNSPAATKAL